MTHLLTRRSVLGLSAAAGLSVLAPTAARAATAQPMNYPPIDFEAASTANYTASNRPTSYAIDMVVIHVTQETYADTIRLFQDPSHKAAAHYVVRSSDGHLAQCVQEKSIAYHAGNWSYNTRSIGIEHEGYVDQPKYFTSALYGTSAQLCAAICRKYGIPIDRDHIIGHVEVPGTDHTDPGPYWDWDRYMSLVASS